MASTVTPHNETKLKPKGSDIIINEINERLEIVIPARGLKGKGIISVIVISVWLFTMLVWSIILFLMKPIYMLYSLPFWAIGIVTLYKALNVLRLEQVIIIDHGKLSLKLTRGSKYDQKDFPREASINLVEGSYYSFSGLSRRGQYPAIINNNEAFGFAERNSTDEKLWLISIIKERLNQQPK